MFNLFVLVVQKSAVHNGFVLIVPVNECTDGQQKNVNIKCKLWL